MLLFKKARELKISIPFEPIITVSVGMPGDHHVRKAFITDECVSCNLCIPTCPTDAIPKNLTIITELCIGCGNCEAACPPAANAIKYTHNSKNYYQFFLNVLKQELKVLNCMRASQMKNQQ